MKKLLFTIALIVVSCLSFGQITNELISSIEDRIIRETENRYEMLVVLSEDGDVIFEKKGVASEILFSEEDLNKMYGAAVAIHNHPHSTGLSLDDISLTIKLNIKEVRAIAPSSIYGHGSWVMRNEGCEDTVISNIMCMGIMQEIRFISRIDWLNHVDSLLSNCNNKNMAARLTRIVMEMQMVTCTGLYRSNNIMFYFEKKNNKCIPFDKVLVDNGWEMKH